jgi:hypothetical protein
MIVPFTKAVAAAATPEALFTANTVHGFKRAKSIIIQARPGNTGKVYIGHVGINKTTFASVMYILAIPAATPTFFDAIKIEVPDGQNIINLEQLYIAVDVDGEGVTGFYAVQ